MIENHQRQMQNTISKMLQKNGESQLFHRAFLRPIQIALKTSDNQTDPNKRQQKRGQLPYGLKQALKYDISSNKYQLRNFQPIPHLPQDIGLNDVQQNNWDNMISVLKSFHAEYKIKVAICICMYSQDKPMLKRTLTGVKQNIAYFVRNGISSHQIIVCVVMDGIQVVHPSIQQFFQELQKESGVYLSDAVQLTPIQQMMQRQNQRVIQEQQITNINQFIFAQQFEDRKKRQFSIRKKQYSDSKKMIKRIQQLQKDKSVTFDSLDKFIEPFFFQVVKQRHKQLYGLQIDLSIKQNLQMIQEKYIDNTSVCRPIIYEALSLTKRNCIQYISTRDNLALLNAFRVDVPVLQNEGNTRFTNARQFDDQINMDDSSVKMNLMFITKYKNRGKLSSHDWFFNGICQEIKPQFSVLLDVGLAPQKDALFKKIRYMEQHKKVGGVCGYMGLKIERVQRNQQVADQNIDCVTSLCMNVVDIQRAQQMQYHFAHLIDKPFESMFGFIHVLPGAFSAYRMNALKPNGEQDSRLLREYFHSIKKETVENSLIKKTQFSPFQVVMKSIIPDFIYDCIWQTDPHGDEDLLYNENVYLAEDRTLCLGIFLNGYKLHYLPDSYAWVDPMKSLYGLLGQRKRWINGSFFAFNRVKKDLNQSGQSTCALSIQILYLQMMNMLAFVAPALFLFTLHIAMYAFYGQIFLPFIQQALLGADSTNSLASTAKLFIYTVDFIYVMVFLGLIFKSMHMNNRVANFQSFVYGASTAYGIISIIIFIILAYDIINGLINETQFLTENENLIGSLTGDPTNDQVLINSLRYVIVGTLGLYAIPVLCFLLLFCKLNIIIDILFSSFSFMFFGSTYLNILNTYALCRIDDISWGTKGLDTEGGTAKERTDNWKKIKIVHVSKLIIWNGIVGFILLSLSNSYATRFYVTYAIMVLLAFTMLIKVFLAVTYLFSYKCCRKPKGRNNTGISQDKVQKLYKERVSNNIKSQIINQTKSQVEDFLRGNSGGALRGNSIMLINKASQIYKPPKDRRKKMTDLYNSRISMNQNKQKKKKLEPIIKQTESRHQQSSQHESSMNNFILSPLKKNSQADKEVFLPQQQQKMEIEIVQSKINKNRRGSHKKGGII